MTKIRPKFEVEELSGEVDHTKYVKDEDGNLVQETVKEPAGFMVYFPSGNSIRVRNEKELKRLGFHRNSTLIDMESGDEVGEVQVGSLKKLSQQKSGRSKSSQAAARANVGDE